MAAAPGKVAVLVSAPATLRADDRFLLYVWVCAKDAEVVKALKAQISENDGKDLLAKDLAIPEPVRKPCMHCILFSVCVCSVHALPNRAHCCGRVATSRSAWQASHH